MSRERRLGRGLEALLGRGADTPATETESVNHSNAGLNDTRQDAATSDGRRWVDVGEIEPNPYQPRRRFDDAEIQTLADSLRTHGLLQPIVVRMVEGRYQLVAGERRLRAAKLVEWKKVPAEVRDVDDRQMAELAIVENEQRKDLNPLEKAASFQRYLAEYQCTQEELASRVQIDRSTVANLIRLLELPEKVKEMLVGGDISQGHARALLPLGEEVEQIQFAELIVRDSLSVRATEAAVKERIRELDTDPLTFSLKDAVKNRARTRQDNLTSLEAELRTALGTKVDIKQSAKGRGRITIHFSNREEFDRLRALLAPSDTSLNRAA